MSSWWKEGSKGAEVLVLGAHPDDAELMVGGTIAKLRNEGRSVIVADCTLAELSTNGTVEVRKRETENASKILGLTNRVNLEFKDGYLNREENLLDSIVSLVRTVKPKLILGPPPVCRHPDHQSLSRVLKDAIFFSGLKKYMPEIPHVKRPKLHYYVEVANETPDYCIDISSFFDVKMQAILSYKSQFEQTESTEETFINSGFVSWIERRCVEWGERLGVKYAEPFKSDAPILLESPL